MFKRDDLVRHVTDAERQDGKVLGVTKYGNIEVIFFNGPQAEWGYWHPDALVLLDAE